MHFKTLFTEKLSIEGNILLFNLISVQAHFTRASHHNAVLMKHSRVTFPSRMNGKTFRLTLGIRRIVLPLAFSLWGVKLYPWDVNSPCTMLCCTWTWITEYSDGTNKQRLNPALRFYLLFIMIFRNHQAQETLWSFLFNKARNETASAQVHTIARLAGCGADVLTYGNLTASCATRRGNKAAAGERSESCDGRGGALSTAAPTWRCSLMLVVLALGTFITIAKTLFSLLLAHAGFNRNKWNKTKRKLLWLRGAENVKLTH